MNSVSAALNTIYVPLPSQFVAPCDPPRPVDVQRPPPKQLLPATARLAPLPPPKLSALLPFPVPSSLATTDRIPLSTMIKMQSNGHGKSFISQSEHKLIIIKTFEVQNPKCMTGQRNKPTEFDNIYSSIT